MPRNATAGAIAVDQEANDVTTVTVSPQTTSLYLRNVPKNVTTGPNPTGVGCKITLPGEPSSGDRYFIQDADGSLSFGHIALVVQDPGDTGVTVDNGSGGFALLQPFTGAWFVFESDPKADTPGNWSVSLDASMFFARFADVVGTGLAAPTGSPAGTPPGNVTPGDLTLVANTPQNLFAIQDSAIGALSGRLDFWLKFDNSAAAKVTIKIQTQQAVTAIAGGSQISQVPPELRFESTTPVTTTGGTITTFATVARTEGAAVTDTLGWDGLVTVVSATGVDTPNGIIVTIEADAATSLTNLSLSADYQALPL